MMNWSVDKEFIPGEYEHWASQPLLQTGEMQPVRDKIDGRLVDLQMLKKWFGVAQMIVKKNGYAGLAFPELNSQLQGELGFGRDLPPNVIFFATSYSRNSNVWRPDSIIINPSISIPRDVKYSQVREACGSTRLGRVGYFADRPDRWTLKGQIYVPGQMGLESVIYDQSTGYGPEVHESKHLSALTIEDEPGLLNDIRLKSIWDRCWQATGLPQDVVMATLRQHEGILVPNHRGACEVVSVAEVGRS